MYDSLSNPLKSYKKIYESFLQSFVNMAPGVNFTNNLWAHLRQYPGAKKVQT